MDYDLIHRVLRDLRERLERVEIAIRQLEAMAQGKPRRGRPPKALAEARKKVGDSDTAIPPRANRRRR